MSSADWTQMCMMNIAHMAWFSSDRAIGEYAQDIWNVPFATPAEASRSKA
jgi:starch phosphorylase